LFTFVKSIRKLDPGEKPPADQLEGYYHQGERYGRKHHESVFVQTDNSKPFMVTESDVERLRASLTLYRDDSINHNKKNHKHNGYANYEVHDSEKNLVYWSRPAGPLGPVYLSPSAIGREVFVNRLDDIFKQRGGYGPCTDTENACPACQLFGMVQEGQLIAGRLRFEDAQLSNPPIDLSTVYHPFVCLPELASPKISATEFYVSKPSPEARLWNYDYYTVGGNDGKPYMPELRGRKFYWHQKASDVKWHLFDARAPVVATSRNVFVRPLKTGLTFRFRIYFDRVSSRELDRLLWVLSIGGRSTGASNSPYGLKVGMGKPVGLGSVSISSESVTLRRVVMDKDAGMVRYDLVDPDWHVASFGKPEEEEKLLGTSRETLDDFLRISDFRSAFANVDYPRITSETKKESYHWFVANKMSRSDSTPMNPAVNQALPSIEHPELSSYKEGRSAPRREGQNRR
jgi:CRISPR-associated protein (TIGR03986 family)